MSARRRGSILVGLLWCLALLSLVVLGVLHTGRLQLVVAKNYGDQTQAHYLALAGLEKAKALLYHDAVKRRRSGQNHSGELYDAPQEFRDVPFGRGQFRVFHAGRAGEGERMRFGISDEESRLNVNQASAEELGKLYRMTPEIAAAILDWRDPDSVVTPGGAEAEYYSGLRPPYVPRNGPFQTVRELLMVRGVSRELFFGEAARPRAGLPSAGGRGNGGAATGEPDGGGEGGWAALLTADSVVNNVSAAGEERVNIQSADEATLGAVRGLSAEIAKAIVSYRGRNRLESLADLLDVAPAPPEDQPRPQPQRVGGPTAPGVVAAPQPPPAANPAAGPAGPKLISETLLQDIADDLTVESERTLPGAVNVNTASAEVLACLPGLDERLAQAIVGYRQSSGFFSSTAALLKVDGLTRATFKQLAPRVTARSETFRILSEGRVPSTGARKRIQVIVQLGRSELTTLSYREDL